MHLEAMIFRILCTKDYDALSYRRKPDGHSMRQSINYFNQSIYYQLCTLRLGNVNKEKNAQ